MRSKKIIRNVRFDEFIFYEATRFLEEERPDWTFSDLVRHALTNFLRNELIKRSGNSY